MWGYKLNAKYWFDWRKQNIIKHKNLLSHIKMSKEVLTLRDIEIWKNKFSHHQSHIFKKGVDIGKVLVSNKISYNEKTINTLLVTCIMIIKLSHYIQCFLKQES